MKNLMKRFGLAVAVLGLVVGTAGRANASLGLVLNGGFETGNFSGWTQAGNTVATFVPSDLPNAHSGNFYANLRPSTINGLLQQNIATTVGDTYHVSFWLASDGGTPNNFSATFGGVTGFSATNLPSSGYIQHTFDVVATSTISGLSFSFRNDSGFLSLDDVYIGINYQLRRPRALDDDLGGHRRLDALGLHQAQSQAGRRLTPEQSDRYSQGPVVPLLGGSSGPLRYLPPVVRIANAAPATAREWTVTNSDTVASENRVIAVDVRFVKGCTKRQDYAGSRRRSIK